MPTLIPQEPNFVTSSERDVWENLRDNLGPDDVIFANVRLTDETKDHEADLIVVLHGVGIVVVEVKGGLVWFDDGWKIKRKGQAHEIDPVTQVREAKYALRTYVSKRSSQPTAVWAHAVVTPYSTFPDDFDLPDLPRWSLHDKGDMENLADRLVENASRVERGFEVPGDAQIESLIQVLSGKPTEPTVHDIAGLVEDTAVRLTKDQATILQVTRLLPRMEIRGGAGSGKTALALAQARQLTRGRQGRPAERVALLCYSLGLASYLKREVATWPYKDRPAFVGTFHDFGVQWGAPAEGARDDHDFWEKNLPTQMSVLADGLDENHKYDSIIVDEAQDFADLWWQPVIKALRDQDHGGLYLYSDENQRIFARFGKPPVQLVPLMLDHNVRNTRQIHEVFGPLAPSRMYAMGDDGPGVTFVDVPAEKALEVADDQVELLMDEGWEPGDIMLLTTGSRHPEQISRQELKGQEEYWESFWDGDDAFYGHVLGAKGLERRAVVLCVNDSQTHERAKERLYVGMSRATVRLVVVGDADYIREVGGTEVAKRLGIS